MSLTNKLTGKAGTLTKGGTSIGFTVISASMKRDPADATDSTDYDSATDIIWKTQLFAATAIELKVEGRYNLSTSATAFTADVLSGNAAAAVVINLNAATILGHGNFDITDFEPKIDIMDVVNYTATLISSGKFTAGS